MPKTEWTFSWCAGSQSMLHKKSMDNRYPAHANIVDTSWNAMQGLRDEWSDWWNVDGAGFGVRPTVETGDELTDAFVWIKQGPYWWLQFVLVLFSYVPSLLAQLLDLLCARLVPKGWNPLLAWTRPRCMNSCSCRGLFRTRDWLVTKWCKIQRRHFCRGPSPKPELKRWPVIEIQR